MTRLHDILRKVPNLLMALTYLCSLHTLSSQDLSVEELRRSVWEVDTPLGTCNAVLLNNTQNDGRQLLLTARHCLRDESDFVTVRLSDRLLDNSDIREVTWTSRNLQVLSSSVNRDYVLYEIMDPIPEYLLPIYAGWNRSSIQPKTVVGWHSLLGQKLFSQDLNRPVYQTLPTEEESEIAPLVNGTWRVLRWEEGFTDLGSSGSPLFNQWGDVVGVLSAGGSTPEAPTNDLYTRFDLVSAEIAQYIGDERSDYCEALDFHQATSGLTKVSAFHRDDTLLSIPQVFEFSEQLHLPTSTVHGLYLPLASAGRNDLLQIEIRDDQGVVLHQQTWSTRARLFGREHFLPIEPAIEVTEGAFEVAVSTAFGVNVYRAASSQGAIVVDGEDVSGHSFLISLLIAGSREEEGEDPNAIISPVVYPNPVTDNLFLEGFAADGLLTLLDAQGRRIRVPSTTDVQGRQIIDFHGLPLGLYYLRDGRGETYPVLYR